MQVFTLDKESHGNECLSQTTAHNLRKRFHEGHELVKYDEREPKSPRTNRNADMIHKVQDFIVNDENLSARIIAKDLNINQPFTKL